MTNFPNLVALTQLATQLTQLATQLIQFTNFCPRAMRQKKTQNLLNLIFLLPAVVSGQIFIQRLQTNTRIRSSMMLKICRFFCGISCGYMVVYIALLRCTIYDRAGVGVFQIFLSIHMQAYGRLYGLIDKYKNTLK